MKRLSVIGAALLGVAQAQVAGPAAPGAGAAAAGVREHHGHGAGPRAHFPRRRAPVDPPIIH
jgi:hypothetical protein